MCLFICGWCELRGRGGAGLCLSLPGGLLRIGVPCPSRVERGALGTGCGWVVGLVVTAGVLEVYHSLTGRVAIWILQSIRVLLRLGDGGGRWDLSSAGVVFGGLGGASGLGVGLGLLGVVSTWVCRLAWFWARGVRMRTFCFRVR